MTPMPQTKKTRVPKLGRARKQKARLILTRDPELYEMQDFLP